MMPIWEIHISLDCICLSINDKSLTLMRWIMSCSRIHKKEYVWGVFYVMMCHLLKYSNLILHVSLFWLVKMKEDDKRVNWHANL